MARHTRIPDAQYGTQNTGDGMARLFVSDGKQQSGSPARFWRVHYLRRASKLEQASLSPPELIRGKFSPDAAHSLDLAAIRLD
jgi:hypothetical protein